MQSVGFCSNWKRCQVDWLTQIRTIYRACQEPVALVMIYKIHAWKLTTVVGSLSRNMIRHECQFSGSVWCIYLNLHGYFGHCFFLCFIMWWDELHIPDLLLFTYEKRTLAVQWFLGWIVKCNYMNCIFWVSRLIYWDDLTRQANFVSTFFAWVTRSVTGFVGLHQAANVSCIFNEQDAGIFIRYRCSLNMSNSHWVCILECFQLAICDIWSCVF